MLAVCGFSGYPDRAAKQSQNAIDYAREQNHAFTLGDVYCFAGCLFSTMIGDIQALETYSHEMEHLSVDGEIGAWLAEAYCYKGEMVCMRGQLEEGIVLIEEGIASSFSRGEYLQLPQMLNLLAQAYSKVGDLSKAWEKINIAFDTMEKSGEHNWESTMYRIRASLHTFLGNFSQAETDLEKALEIARRQGARSWELQAAIDLARLRQQQGRLDEARSGLTEVYSWFTEGFDTPDLKKARELLAAIG